MPPLDPISDRIEQALRLAAVAHRDQSRRSSGVPYMPPPVAVARIVERAGGGEDAVIAALLHDVVEDTGVRLEKIIQEFGFDVAATVADCSEIKLDAQGQPRPWEDRKRDFLATLGSVGPDARLVILANKLHNLQCIRLDLAAGLPIWESFHAPKARVLFYSWAFIERLGAGHEDDVGVAHLTAAGLDEHQRVLTIEAGKAKFSGLEG